MDTFFGLRFRRKACDPSRRRRSSVSLPASKARRRSSVGLPSAGLAQRRRSSAQLQISDVQALQYRRGRFTRRRSSGATACLTPRFSIRRRQAAKHRSIHAQLLGPSLLLASVVQMSDKSQDHETEDRSAEEYSSVSDSDCSQEEQEQDGVDLETESEKCRTWLAQGLVTGESIQPRPLIRAPRCLRRNSSHLLPAEAVYRSPAFYGVYGRYRRTSQAGGLWTGRRNSAAARGSVALYRKASTFWPDFTLSHTLQGTYYNPQTDTWSGFLSYVEP